MATGSVEYSAPIASVRFAPIEVPNPHPSVEKFVVEADSEQLKVVLHLVDVFTDANANAIAVDILASIINRLAFELNVSIGEPHMTGVTLPKNASGTLHTVSKSVHSTYGIAAPTLTLGEDKRQELAELLEQPTARADLYSVFRFAANQRDAVARFMFLYNILLQLHDDDQKRLDHFVRQQDPKVPQSPRPDRSSVTETVYTRLRNQVGHRRSGTTPRQTRSEIEANVGSFQELVRTAISSTGEQ